MTALTVQKYPIHYQSDGSTQTKQIAIDLAQVPIVNEISKPILLEQVKLNSLPEPLTNTNFRELSSMKARIEMDANASLLALCAMSALIVAGIALSILLPIYVAPVLWFLLTGPVGIGIIALVWFGGEAVSDDYQRRAKQIETFNNLAYSLKPYEQGDPERFRLAWKFCKERGEELHNGLDERIKKMSDDIQIKRKYHQLVSTDDEQKLANLQKAKENWKVVMQFYRQFQEHFALSGHEKND